MSPAQTMFSLLLQFQQAQLSLRQVSALYHLAASPAQDTLADIRHALGIYRRNGSFAAELKRMTAAGLISFTSARNVNNLTLHHYRLTPAGYKFIRIRLLVSGEAVSQSQSLPSHPPSSHHVPPRRHPPLAAS